MSSETRSCQNCSTNFEITADDFLYYEKMQVPPPTFCPECRFVRRTVPYNERTLYMRNCDKCSKRTMSIYAPDKDLTVYCHDCWWSDDWSGADYARDWDPDRPFLAQVYDLMLETPHMALESNTPTLVNCDFINAAAYSKDCYLIFLADYCENVLYSNILAHNKDSADCTILRDSELCYECVNCIKCYNVHFSEDCTDCNDMYFSKNCVGCSNCFGCVNLRKQSYCWFNEQLTKEEYIQRVRQVGVTSRSALKNLREKVHEFWLQHPQKYYHGQQNLNVTGDYVTQSKNSQHVFQSSHVEDSKFIMLVTLPKVTNTYDYCIWGNNVDHVYESSTCGENASNIKFCYSCWPNVARLEYCFFTGSAEDSFGCVNHRKAKHCILNKQYSPEEYERLKAEIVQNMKDNPYITQDGKVYRYGEFFPPEFSHFGYNESKMMDYTPLTKEQAIEQGYQWYDKPSKGYQSTITWDEIPDDISNVDGGILREIPPCQTCQSPFRIVLSELDLLRRFGIAIPESCADCRHSARQRRINFPRLHNRVTADGAEVQTAYSPDDPTQILSEEGYQQEVL